MAKTASAMNPLGTVAPDFTLPDPCSNQLISLHKAAGSVATVIVFMCNHCPFVKHILPELPRLIHDFSEKGVKLIAINANDVATYPDDAPEHMKALALDNQFTFPYLFDETQTVARAYDARCTPDFFVYDKQLRLVYRGQLDDARPGLALPVNGESLRQALTCLIENKPLSEPQKPSLGCNIKWKDRAC